MQTHGWIRVTGVMDSAPGCAHFDRAAYRDRYIRFLRYHDTVPRRYWNEAIYERVIWRWQYVLTT